VGLRQRAVVAQLWKPAGTGCHLVRVPRVRVCAQASWSCQTVRGRAPLAVVRVPVCELWALAGMPQEEPCPWGMGYDYDVTRWAAWERAMIPSGVHRCSLAAVRLCLVIGP